MRERSRSADDRNVPRVAGTAKDLLETPRVRRYIRTDVAGVVHRENALLPGLDGLVKAPAGFLGKPLGHGEPRSIRCLFLNGGIDDIRLTGRVGVLGILNGAHGKERNSVAAGIRVHLSREDAVPNEVEPRGVLPFVLVLGDIPAGLHLVKDNIRREDNVKADDAREPKENGDFPPVVDAGEEREAHDKERQAEEEEEKDPLHDRGAKVLEGEVANEVVPPPGVLNKGPGNNQGG